MLAGRYLRARRREASISAIAGFSFLGIMLGVAALIIVMAVMNGFRTELLSKILGINGHLIIEPIDRPLDDFDAVADRIAALDSVIAAIPLVEGQVLASGRDTSRGALVRGIREQDFAGLPAVANNILQGSIEGFDENQGVLVGSRLAAGLGLRLGDRITLVSPRGAVTPMGVAPRVKAYPIIGIFELGMSEYDATFVFMQQREAQLYFNKEDTVSFIEVYVKDPDMVGELRAEISDAAGRSTFITDWQQRNATFFSALQVERNVMFIILTLIILVAALNIISGMIMLVKEKGRDIGVLRTMGATRGAIMRIFFITGASIGVVGTFAGLALGTVVCLNIENIRQFLSSLTQTELFPSELYFLSQLPADMDNSQVASVVVMALVLSVLATLYPAWRAASLDPVDALRYE
ncbi:MAG: lipoprotein-releasing ABC transporter permease subunit [Rhizobiales bacterium]|nr:lipoprotein-releasing ABC transporter permease subunit [Hyphomicrobiales bacterium]